MESLSGRPSGIAEGYIAIGRVGAAWGIRGEVKVALHTDFPQRFQSLDIVYLGPDAQPVKVLSSRPHKGQILMRLEGYPDRNAVEALRGLWVQIPEAEVMPLPEDEHYVFELVGLRARTTDGRYLGKIVEVLFTGANEVFVIQGETGEVLVPYIREVVVGEDFDAGEIVIDPIPGLLD